MLLKTLMLEFPKNEEKLYKIFEQLEEEESLKSVDLTNKKK